MDDALRSKHSGLVNGLTKLFDLLVTLRYIAATDVLHPPHTDPPVDTAGLTRLGFDPEVVALAPLLPQLRNDIVWGFQEEGAALLPHHSKAVNYLVRPNHDFDEVWDRLRVGYEPYSVFPPTMLRLTDGGRYGHHLLYDTADQTITMWTTLRGKIWDAFPRRPSSIVLDEIISKLTRLEWVPNYDPADEHDCPVRDIMETPAYMANEWPFGMGAATGIKVPLDDDAVLLALASQHFDSAQVDGLRQQVNHWHALQKLYLDAGWDCTDSDPSSSLDGDKFERLRADWMQRFKEIDREWGDWLLRGQRTLSAQEQLELDDIDRRWEAFWAESAGNRRV